MSPCPPLQPKWGAALFVVFVVRISTEHQDPRSREDQLAFCLEYLRHHYLGEIKEVVLSSQGSGEHLDRREFIRLEQTLTIPRSAGS